MIFDNFRSGAGLVGLQLKITDFGPLELWSWTGPFLYWIAFANELFFNHLSSGAGLVRFCVGLLLKIMFFDHLSSGAGSVRFCIGFLLKFIIFGPLELWSWIGPILYWIAIENN